MQAFGLIPNNTNYLLPIRAYLRGPGSRRHSLPAAPHPSRHPRPAAGLRSRRPTGATAATACLPSHGLSTVVDTNQEPYKNKIIVNRLVS